MPMQQSNFPTKPVRAPEFVYPNGYVEFPGVVPHSEVAAEPSLGLLHLLPQVKPDMRIEMEDAARSFNALYQIESVDRDGRRVVARLLRLYEAEPVPESELRTGGMAVEFRTGEERWSVISLDPEPGQSPVIRSGFFSARAAAAELARLTGGQRKRAKAA